jgi:type II secretory pathway pseudopilin PulG
VRKSDSGHSLLEVVVVLAIIGAVVLSAMPAFASIQRRSALRAASAEMRSIFHLARSRAIARGRNAGVRFVKIGPNWYFTIYDDGDGDGIRTEDISRGVDRPVGPPQLVFGASRIVSIGLPESTILDPDGDRLLPTASPVQFGRSAICSFSPLGQSSPGTVYLSDRDRGVYAVRVYGTTAKIRVLRYEPSTRKWMAW